MTSGLDAVQSRCIDAVVSTLQLLNQPFTQRIIDSQYQGNQPLVSFPCTVLTTDDGQDTDEAAMNGRDDIGHPVKCQIMVSCVKFDNSTKRLLLKYRQAVFRAFHNQRLSGVIESIVNKVEFGDIAPRHGRLAAGPERTHHPLHHPGSPRVGCVTHRERSNV